METPNKDTSLTTQKKKKKKERKKPIRCKSNTFYINASWRF